MIIEGVSLTILLPAWLLVGCSAAGMIVLRQFLTRLKEAHPDAWQGLSRPLLVNPENAHEANQLFLFIAGGRFDQLGDQELSRLGQRLRWIAGLTLLNMTMLFVVLQSQ